MKKWNFILGLYASVLLVTVGCLNTARTNYNEVGLFSGKSLNDEGVELATPPQDAVSVWPFYISDGRASYYLWPLIKNSPGCFAFLPFYNYDHGIHDIALLCTLSPKSGEYRFFPLYWQNREGWTLLPIAYSYGKANSYTRGVPLIFNAYCDGSWRGHFTIPLYWYETTTDENDDDYSFWSLPYMQKNRTYEFSLAHARENGATKRSQRNFYAGSGLRLYGHIREESWDGALSDAPETRQNYSYYEHRWLFPLWWYGHDRNDDAWHHLFPLWWSWYDASIKQQNRLLFPLFFSRSYDDKGLYLFSPLAGYGENQSKTAWWWYALTAGAVRAENDRTSWFLPFYWSTDNKTERYHNQTTWTLLGGVSSSRQFLASQPSVYTGKFSESWYVGPILPLIACGTNSQSKSTTQVLLSLGYYGAREYLTTTTDAGEVERLGLKRRFDLALVGLYSYERFYAPFRQQGEKTVEVYDQQRTKWNNNPKEGRCFSLLGRFYYDADVVTYQLEDVIANRDIGVREKSLGLGWLLWNHTTKTTVGERVEQPGAVNNTTEGVWYSLLGDLWAYEHEERVLQSECFQKTPAPTETPSVRNFNTSWKLAWTLLGGASEKREWNWSEKRQRFEYSPQSRKSKQAFFVSHDYRIDEAGQRVAGDYRTRILFDLFSVSREPYGKASSFKWGLLWNLLAHYETEFGDGDSYRINHRLLLGLPYLHRSNQRVSSLIMEDSNVTGQKITKYVETAGLLGFLYRRGGYGTTETGYGHRSWHYYKGELQCKNCLAGDPCRLTKVREDEYRETMGWALGILFHRNFRDNRTWERDPSHPAGERLVRDDYADDRYTFFGIPYQWHGQRDGSYKHNSVWGLLFDQTVNVTEETETFGFLGFFYRYNKYKDGSQTRYVFPFITTESNEKNQTWSFGFLHKLFRIEKHADGSYKTWYFWL